MRASKYLLVLSVGAMFLFGMSAMAFHDGGVAHCNGCHTMHNSAGNPADTPAGNQFLLKQSNSTDMCLNCHATSRGNIWGGPDPLAPGNNYGAGQFVFLTEDNLNDARGSAILGHQAGHNVISIDKGTAADPVNTPMGPGGAYLSSNMHCTSCHDPHGKGGHYRLLYGSDYPESFAMGYSFNYTAPAPDAVGISFSSSAPQESNTNHVAYLGGVSEWCGNCHGDFHNDSYPTVLKHPNGVAIGADHAANYNMYEGTGTYTGDGTDSYLALVPLEDPTFSTTYAGPASGSSKVHCLTCHRSHASSAPDSGRWDFNISEWVEEGVGGQTGLPTYPIPNPYAATSGTSQRSLCNKCHAQDPEL